MNIYRLIDYFYGKGYNKEEISIAVLTILMVGADLDEWYHEFSLSKYPKPTLNCLKYEEYTPRNVVKLPEGEEYLVELYEEGELYDSMYLIAKVFDSLPDNSSYEDVKSAVKSVFVDKDYIVKEVKEDFKEYNYVYSSCEGQIITYETPLHPHLAYETCNLCGNRWDYLGMTYLDEEEIYETLHQLFLDCEYGIPYPETVIPLVERDLYERLGGI